MAAIKRYNVKDSELLTCSLDSQNSILHVPVFHGSSVRGKNEATIKGVEINGETVLLSSSILSCACGRIIKINYSKG